MTVSVAHRLFGLATTLAFLALPAPGLAPVVAQSGDSARYAAIVVDAATGEVLFARQADAQRFPASVTKIMTLYLTFEALSEGRVSLDDVVTVSPLAASQAPSKLGLAAGQTIRLDDAMRATTVRSANDMAMLLAEHVGGSQARFAEMATKKARELGMTQTRYVNPNGLPDSRQVTSAHDLSILARAVMRDYPQYYSYFGLHDWAYQGRDYRNTNGLLATAAGYDGIKTGYTNASGYNLAASAVRDKRRLITIVMGGRSSASRNAHVAELMNTGFELEGRRLRGEPIRVAQTFFEQRGFGIGGPTSDTGAGAPIAYASVGEEDGVADRGSGDAFTALSRPLPQAPYGSQTSRLLSETTPSSTAVPYRPLATANATPPISTSSLNAPRSVVANTPPLSARAETRPPTNMTAALNGAPPGAAVANIRRPSATTTRTPTTPVRPAARPAAQRWAVQVGAFKDQKVATDWLAEINRRFRSQFASADRDVQSAAGWYRSRFVGLTETAAKSACDALSERRVTCQIIRPEQTS